jgi:hypothetical protein
VRPGSEAPLLNVPRLAFLDRDEATDKLRVIATARGGTRIAVYVEPSSLHYVALSAAIVRPNATDVSAARDLEAAPGVRLHPGSIVDIEPARHGAAVQITHDSRVIRLAGFVAPDRIGRVYEATGRPSLNAGDASHTLARRALFLDRPRSKPLAALGPDTQHWMETREKKLLVHKLDARDGHTLVRFDSAEFSIVGWIADDAVAELSKRDEHWGGYSSGMSDPSEPHAGPTLAPGSRLYDARDGIAVGYVPFESPLGAFAEHDEWIELDLETEVGIVTVWTPRASILNKD